MNRQMENKHQETFPLPWPLLARSSPGCLSSDCCWFREWVQVESLADWPSQACTAVVSFGFQGSRSRDLSCQREKRMLLMRGSRDEPLQNSIEVRFFFGTDAVAGYLTMGHALQVQGFDQLVHREMAAKIRLVTQDQEWDPLHGWLLKEDVELFFGYW